jgi:hypothetical protein
MELSHVNTSKFLFDPKDEDFEAKMTKKSNVFDLKSNRKEWLTYICVLYDPHSYLRNNIKDYITRKYEAAIISGFKLGKDNKFDISIEDKLVSEDDDFNKVICKYVSYAYKNDLNLLELLIDKYDLEIDTQHDRLGSLDNKARKNLWGMKDDIEQIDVKIFGGEETVRFKKIFYEKIDHKYLQLLVDSYNFEIKKRKSNDSSLSSGERENLKGMRQDIEDLEVKIFSGEEVINMRKALYSGVDSQRDKMPRLEQMLKQFEEDGLESWSPYEKGYKPEKLKFVGDVIQKN